MISIGLDLGNVVGRFVDCKKYVEEYFNTFIKNFRAAQVANLPPAREFSSGTSCTCLDRSVGKLVRRDDLIKFLLVFSSF